MNRERIYVAPSARRGVGYSSRYFLLLKQKLARHYDVLEADNSPCLMQSLPLIANAFKADIFLLSFVETIAFHKLAAAQSLIAAISIEIMHLRRRKIVFIFHNMRPHKGENRLSRWLTRLQFKRSQLVIAHSGAAAQFAREQIGRLGGDTSKVVYICHPFPENSAKAVETKETGTDVLIWGNILPYKGVLEFISRDDVKDSGLKVRILGHCADSGLAKTIQGRVRECGNISFDNRKAGFDEIADAIASSRFVLFPYLKGSISSSGVLMDTLAMGGVPVGPGVGAFADLAAEGVCLCYDNDSEMLDILRSERSIDASAREAFIACNSWDAFEQKIYDSLERIRLTRLAK